MVPVADSARPLLTVLVLSTLAAPAGAATLSDVGLSEAQVRALYSQIDAPAATPGIAFGSPVAFGVGWGQAFLAAGGQTVDTAPGATTEDLDGSFMVGAGFGDPFSTVGVEVAATSVSVRSSFGDSGHFGGKIHRVVGERMAIAAGIENTGQWGDAVHADSSLFVVGTKVFHLSDSPENPVPLSLNLGVGDSRFTRDVTGDGVGVFGSVALAPWRRASVIADWTGRDLNAALSVVPFSGMPVVLTLGFANLGERFKTREFAGGLGVGFRF